MNEGRRWPGGSGHCLRQARCRYTSAVTTRRRRVFAPATGTCNEDTARQQGLPSSVNRPVKHGRDPDPVAVVTVEKYLGEGHIIKQESQFEL